MSKLSRVAIFLTVAALLVVALRWSQRQGDALVVSGFVEADQIRLGSRLGGRVGVVHVEEGERVDAGAALLELEPFDLNEQRAGAAAVLAGARAELAHRESGLRAAERAQARARRDRLSARLALLVNGPRDQELATGGRLVDLARAELELATVEHTRVRALHEDGIESTELLDRAVTSMRVAEAALAVRREELALLEEGTRTEEIDAARAEVAEATAALDLAEQGYREEDIDKARAAVAAAESALAAIDRSLWVRAYVPEGRLALRVGQDVELHVDPFPGETFRGRISFIAREAEFTPGNVQTPEERSKQVFRIKVELADGFDRVRPGMSADVVLDDGGGSR